MAENIHPLKEYRQRAGLSVSDLAEKVGVSRQSIFRIEAGDQTPSLDLVSRITRATGGKVTANDFLRSLSLRGSAA
jgi:DNA-binding XRE family transcriptional regulator